MKQPREITNKVHAALEDGTLSYQQVAEAAMIFLSEDDVERMAHNEEFFIHEHYEDWDFDEADDEE